MFRGPQFWQKFRERRLARRTTKRLLQVYSEVRRAKPDLVGGALYREVLLCPADVDSSEIDEVLSQAKNSVDEWTAPGREGLGFRELVHFLIVSSYETTDDVGSVVSFRDIVDALVPRSM